jgi:hypothetical protein
LALIVFTSPASTQTIEVPYTIQLKDGEQFTLPLTIGSATPTPKHDSNNASLLRTLKRSDGSLSLYTWSFFPHADSPAAAILFQTRPVELWTAINLDPMMNNNTRAVAR